MYVLFYWHNVTPLLLDCSHNISDELFCESLHTRMHVVELWQFSCSQTQSGCRRYSVKTAISFSKKHGFRFRFKADQCVYICWWFWLSECHLCRCESVTSAYLMVRSSLCPYVYICCLTWPSCCVLLVWLDHRCTPCWLQQLEALGLHLMPTVSQHSCLMNMQHMYLCACFSLIYRKFVIESRWVTQSAAESVKLCTYKIVMEFL